MSEDKEHVGGYKTITIDDISYPWNLRNIDTAPQKLWVLGDLNLRDYKHVVAIVGSRNMTTNGADNAFSFARELAKQGVAIVSGMARGIDTQAHKGALSVGGKTIAVMATGIDIVYPPENKALYEQIAKEGVVITQFPPGSAPEKHHFLTRNGTISGIAQVVLVVEGGEKSGTISTSNWAGMQGREVCAIPGSPATNYLIGNGASMVYTLFRC